MKKQITLLMIFATLLSSFSFFNFSTNILAAENWKLPFESGVRVIVTQGYNSNFSHANTKALDLWAASTNILASKSGRIHVMRSGGDRDKWCQNSDECNKMGYTQAGNYIIIDHLDNTFSFYTHLQAGSIVISTGQYVKQGQRLATMGGTGYTCGDDSCTRPGAHLHFQVSSNGATIDAPIEECGLCIPKEGDRIISQNRTSDSSLISISSMMNSNFVIDASKSFNQSRVWVWTKHGGNNQKWLYNKDTLQIKSLESNRCLDSGNPYKSDDRWLRLNDCHGGENQKWLINSNNQLYNPKVDNLCLDSYSGDKEKSTLYLGRCHNGNNQKWRLENI